MTDLRASIARRTRNWTAGIAAAAAFIGLLGAAQVVHAEPLQFTPTDFLILSPDGRQKIGFCSFRLEKTPSGATLHGASRYVGGESDFETVSLAVPDDGTPRPLQFVHSFFDAGGKAILSVEANFITGEAHCADYRPDSIYDETATMSFPPDTWAGASVAIPIQRLLRMGDIATTQLHFFTCTPGPKIFAVDIAPDNARSRWPLYRGDLVKVDVRPYFGLFDVLVRAFVPHLEAWFDPSSSWDFVGAQMARYYKGPAIIMVKAPAQSPAVAAGSVAPSTVAGAPATGIKPARPN